MSLSSPLRAARRGAIEALCALACLAGPSILANVACVLLLPGDALMDARNALRLAALMLGYTLWVRWREKRSVTELGPKGALPELGVGVAVGAAMVAAAAGAMALGGAYRVVGVNGWDHAAKLVPLVLTLALLEEMLFRLILLRLLERWLGTTTALVASSLLFGLAHLGMGPANVPSTLLLGLEGGLLFGAAYLLTRRLWLCLGLHFGWNFMQMGILSADATMALKRSGLLQSEIAGPAWLTGGVHGMEAGLPAAVVCLGVAAVLLALERRKGQRGRTQGSLATQAA